MYLARVQLDPRRREAGRWMTAPNTLHAALMSAVDPADDERLLWRLDQWESLAELYVLTPRECDLGPLVKVGGGESTWQSREMSPLLHGLTGGQLWRFRLTASPTVALARTADDGGRPRGKVIPLVKRDEQVDWLIRKSREAGFGVETGGERTAYVSEQRRWVFSRATSKPSGPGSRVTLHTATFEGLLTVTDPIRLGQTLGAGIGRGKAYGCGLLTLARA